MSETIITSDQAADKDGAQMTHKLHFNLAFANDTLAMLAKSANDVLVSTPHYFGRCPLAWFIQMERDEKSVVAGVGKKLAIWLVCENAADDKNLEKLTGCECKVETCLLSISSYNKAASLTAALYDLHSTAVEWYDGYKPLLSVEFEHLLNPANEFLNNNDGDTLMLTVELKLHSVTNSSPMDSSNFPFFNAAHTWNDITFVVGGEKVHANRTYLGMCSPYFERMFESEMLECQLKEIPMGKDVELGEFIELLLVIYPTRKAIDRYNVEYILKLADRFLMEHVVQDCEKYLLKKCSDFWPLSKRFVLVQTYPSLTKFKAQCLEAVTSLAALRELQKEAGYSQLNSAIKEAILDNFGKISAE